MSQIINNNREYDRFRANIKTIIDEEVHKILQQKNLYECHTGTIIDAFPAKSDDPYKQKCNVDLFFTQLNNVANKSGELLLPNDSVVVFEKIGSHYSNCFVAYKNQ